MKQIFKLSFPPDKEQKWKLMYLEWNWKVTGKPLMKRRSEAELEKYTGK